MPQMKYFQGIADIERHYADILRNYRNEKFGKSLLESWDIEWNEEEAIKEEKEVLRYLIGCQLGIVHEANAVKPSVELVNRCFNRHLSFLANVFSCDQTNVNKFDSKLIIREYKTCAHYLFKFSCAGWVAKLPEEILTFENKYKDSL